MMRDRVRAETQLVHLAYRAMVMRKPIERLAAMVHVPFYLDPLAPAIFFFCNRQRDKLKTLYREHEIRL